MKNIMASLVPVELERFKTEHVCQVFLLSGCFKHRPSVSQMCNPDTNGQFDWGMASSNGPISHTPCSNSTFKLSV